MERKASKFLKWLYCLTLVAMIVPSGMLGASGMVGMATGGGLLGHGALVALLLVVGFLFRIYQIVRFPNTLDVYVSGMFSKALRGLGVFLMIVGLSASLLILFIKPLALAISGQSGDNGVVFFAVGVYLYFISVAGWLGVILFEVGRFVGLVAKRMNQSG
jgi:hypothetical protein